MGLTSSTLMSLVKKEFDRLAKDRGHLSLDDILGFRLGDTSWGVDPENIGVLFAIDRHRSGRFGLEELQTFAQDWNSLGHSSQAYELHSTVHARCMMHFWQHIATDEGLKVAIDWLIQLVMYNHSYTTDWDAVEVETAGPAQPADTPLAPTISILGAADAAPDDAPRSFREHPDIMFIHQQSLFGLYRILGHQAATRNDMQSFVNILQRLAEDRDQLELSNSALDDWIPEPVLRDYIKEVLQNCRQLVNDMEILQDALHTSPPPRVQADAAGQHR